MDNPSPQSKSPSWPWEWTIDKLPNPFALFAPRSLDQSINPGWAIGNIISVTEQNSAAPDTERDIAASYSYGRQLGRVIDALAVLIAERPEESSDVKALDDLMALRDEIDAIKSRAAARRLERLGSDLETLKKTDADEYRRVTAALRNALDDQGQA